MLTSKFMHEGLTRQCCSVTVSTVSLNMKPSFQTQKTRWTFSGRHCHLFLTDHAGSNGQSVEFVLFFSLLFLFSSFAEGADGRTDTCSCPTHSREDRLNHSTTHASNQTGACTHKGRPYRKMSQSVWQKRKGKGSRSLCFPSRFLNLSLHGHQEKKKH